MHLMRLQTTHYKTLAISRMERRVLIVLFGHVVGSLARLLVYRNGSGIQPPVRLVNPFISKQPEPQQDKVYAFQGLKKDVFRALKQMSTPARWLAIRASLWTIYPK